MTNWSINLAVVNSLRSKLANKKVKGVFWPVVKSLRGVWAFFPKKSMVQSTIFPWASKITILCQDEIKQR